VNFSTDRLRAYDDGFYGLIICKRKNQENALLFILIQLLLLISAGTEIWANVILEKSIFFTACFIIIENRRKS
jgi:hypothetical protein